ncbi:DUF6541 family protein [Brachybacterium sp. YJGR34]|uniref:DUF6541 family protein n=1 Tax=Brachybacterium sp. YJGR34 TaxID=2059911 RepID=UPI000E0BF52D|nr:DUF6541 family protein [Brachybacterium sp. YJGR34]
MSTLLPVLLSWALLAGPGFLLLVLAEVRMPVRWGIAPVITVVLATVLGAVLHVLGLRWSVGTVIIGLLLAVLGVLGAKLLLVSWRGRRRGRHLRGQGGARPPSVLPQLVSVGGSGARRSRPVAAAVTGCALLMGLFTVASAARRMGGIDTLNGSYDSFFHLSANAFIRADGDAFPLTALQDIYGEPTYYPVTFDALGALLPWDPVTSSNALMLACLAALPAAVAAMVAALVTDRVRGPVLALCAAGASTLFLSTAAMGLVMGLWPIVLGTVCLPPAVAAVLRLGDRAARRRRPEVLLAVVLVAGAALAHPSVLFSAAVVGGSVLIGHGIVDLQRGLRRRGLVLLLVAALAAGVYLLGSMVTLAGMDLTRPSGLGAGELLRQILTDTPRIPALADPFWPLATVWLLALLGGVLAVRRREPVMVSALVALGATIVLGMATDLPGTIATALVNPWYGARERIAPLMMCVLVLLMARGLGTLMTERTRLLRVGAITATALLWITIVLGLVVPGRLPLLGSLAYTAYGVQLSPYVTPEEREFIERTAQELPEDAVVLADPRDGATLYWSLGGVRTVYPTMARPITEDQRLIGRYVAEPDDRGRVCEALERQQPTHLYVDSSAYSGRSLDPEASEPWAGVHRVPDHLLTPVDEDGPYALYEFTPPC